MHRRESTSVLRRAAVGCAAACLAFYAPETAMAASCNDGLECYRASEFKPYSQAYTTPRGWSMCGKSRAFHGGTNQPCVNGHFWGGCETKAEAAQRTANGGSLSCSWAACPKGTVANLNLDWVPSYQKPNRFPGLACACCGRATTTAAPKTTATTAVESTTTNTIFEAMLAASEKKALQFMETQIRNSASTVAALATRMGALESKNKVLTESNTFLRGKVAALEASTSDLTLASSVRQKQIDRAQLEIEDIMEKIMNVGAVDVVEPGSKSSSCGSAQCKPQIEASGTQMSVQAPKIVFSAEACEVDLCDLDSRINAVIAAMAGRQ